MSVINVRILGHNENKFLIKVVAVLIALLTITALICGCCSTIPVNQAFSTYAPTLAPPLAPKVLGVGTSVGCLAPDFELTDLNGREVRLSDFQGRPVLLNFWTYCSACKAELPYIQSVYDDCQSMIPNLVVLAVNVSQPADQVKEFVSYYGFTFEFLLDSWATTASDYYVHKIPTTFFIDKNGIIQDLNVGGFSNATAIKQRVVALANQ